MSENEEMDDLNELINDASETENNKTFLSKEDKKKKEFKLKNTEDDIRFLTFDKEKEGTDSIFFAKAYFHSMKIGDYMQKVYCNKNDNKKCPICEKSKKILASQKDKNDKDTFKKAMSYASREYTIFKILDMGAIKDKTKFWRTTKPIEGVSVLDKLVSAVKRFKEDYPNNKFYDLHTGVTFRVDSIQKSLNQNKKIKYFEVSQIMPRSKPTAISDDEQFINDIKNETVRWEDIFNKFEIKDVFTFDEFLNLCVEGNAPYWDKDEKTFIFPNHPELSKKYRKVVEERRTNFGDDDDDSDDDSLEDIEKKYSNVVSNNNSIEDMDEDEDIDDDDDLPF